ncbi:tail-collar fiber protein [Pseudomonas brenneri]|nr:tail-collar fiber protein [Pseudomonas brenneri]
MGASITLAGESLIAQKQGAQLPLVVSRFILANVPGLNPTGPVNRAAGKPPAAQIVGTYEVTQKGFVNPNQVVYSLMLGSDVGDFDWNWIGMETADNVLLAVAYVPVQQKRKNIPPQQLGNNVTRNFLVVFDGAQALTGITIDAKTWQHDFTVRLAGIDERERLSNRDIYGPSCFFGTAWQVEKVGNVYQVKPGQAYVEGIRLISTAVTPVTVPAVPTAVWLDVALERQLSDVVPRWSVVCAANKVDYTDSAGTRHYCIRLADLSASAVTDRRSVEPINSSLLQYLAARTGDYQNLRARATTKDDVGLGKLPNALSDDDASDSSVVLATTKAVRSLRTALSKLIKDLVDGATPAGKAKKLETARKVAISGACTGSANFDGGADIDIALTLANSSIKAGTYTKVSFNEKGLAVSGSNPTRLVDYSITDALYVGGPSTQRPALSAPKAGGLNVVGAGALEIREAQLVANTSRDFLYAPRLFFNWSNVVAGELAMDSTKRLLWNSDAIWTTATFDPSRKADVGTTLESYGITNALTVGPPSSQRPILASPKSVAEASGYGGALEIREAQLVGTNQSSLDYSPRILFLWNGRVSRGFGMDAQGLPRWGESFIPLLQQVAPTVSIEPTGHIIMPKEMGGWIIQWFEGPLSKSENDPYPAINFPFAFPVACVFAGAFTRSTTDTILSDQMFQVSSWTRQAIKLFPQWFGTGAQGLNRPLIFAIGK